MPLIRASQLIRPLRRPERPEQSRRPPLIRELLLVSVLYLAYKLGRRAANGQFHDAYENAERVWDLERALRLPSEAAVQDLVLHSEALIRFINVYYATVHFPATVAFLIWMYWRRPGFYVWVRWVITWLTGAALVLHLLVPLAPPRLFRPLRMIDTGLVYGPAVYDKPDPDSMANQFAAMPSLHVGWSVLIAVGLIVATRSRWRWLWLAHPLITVTAVVATAHHYWMDGLVACAILGAVLFFLRPPRRSAPQATGGRRRSADGTPTTVPTTEVTGPDAVPEIGTVGPGALREGRAATELAGPEARLAPKDG
ncbi:inositol phosphorylceramide synthase [Streptomyces sp. 3MP-14]|uniref:Inositol phosphorylceramide synthase n=1 Tax=Streptomyces mimosae TaxID=2586635 RepID=A0A5N6AFD1_9ACTN|nr:MULTISPECIES: phosphatase PAP2 family protein [Streptomyces]KAB8166499.1 inositol phosphorylceramide synthase [Streptomyces mimosae]KAB8178928.1 inositol phosphorylceramide synthase [Streptomyces sp. 3MP-14]